jgi:hypothetical protein
MSYIGLVGRWCNTIVLNVQVSREDKSDDSKGTFYEEYEQVIDIFLNTTRKLGQEFNTKLGKGNIFKPKLGMRFYIIIVLAL